MTHDPLVIREAASSELEWVRSLFEEYASSLGVDLSFQEFDREVSALPGDYAPPRGRLLLALRQGQPLGCVGLRPLSDDVCELKRLYVRPAARGSGLGRLLTAKAIDEARRIGYRQMCLDTLPFMDKAIALYQSFGFKEIPAYRYNPVSGTRYLSLDLQPL
jgi:GNAT superfamily N-acetyltransferase